MHVKSISFGSTDYGRIIVLKKPTYSEKTESFKQKKIQKDAKIKKKKFTQQLFIQQTTPPTIIY
ncbi:hypothetical protein QTP88_012357 [Uroleucon formosanum]